MQRPDPNDPILTEAFNRLQAELRLASFEVLVAEQGTQRSVAALRHSAMQAGAFAAVDFARNDQATSVNVWIQDRRSGNTITRTLELADVEDAPRVLALRAVDFVRSALRDSDASAPASVAPPRLKPEPRVPARPTQRRERAIQLRVGAEAAFTGPAKVAYGPAVGLSYRVRNVQLGLSFSGPSLGAEWRDPEGAVTFHQELLLADARWEVLELPPFALAPTLGVGAFQLSARGQATAPLVARTASVWAFAGAPGLALRTTLSADLYLDVSGRALVLLPWPGLRIDQDSTLLARPMFTAGIGLGVEF